MKIKTPTEGGGTELTTLTDLLSIGATGGHVNTTPPAATATVVSQNALSFKLDRLSVTRMVARATNKEARRITGNLYSRHSHLLYLFWEKKWN